ncbi:PadR family transcriptional regulator [Cellulosimicrobium sp. MI9406]|uniref:PadR family transcriptional regulator n=1 Tax=Cellulosimicrobium sp. MI9406 TaxID=2931398 RepID=UPI0033AC76DA
MRFDERLDRELLRGVLPLCVLAVVATHGPTYGYAITRSLADAGLGTVKGGTLYPLLQRLEDDGLVTTSWHQGERGPSRRYYAVTDQGRVALADATSRWDAVTTAATTLVAGAPSPDRPSPAAGLDPRAGARPDPDPGTGPVHGLVHEPVHGPVREPGALPTDAPPPDPTPTRTPR